MRPVCMWLIALIALGGVAIADDYTEPFALADSYVAPEYPPAAEAGRFDGSVSVAAVINTDGSVGVVEVIETTRPRIGFEEAAIEAIRQWRFEPARENGQAVDSVYAYVFHFDPPRTGRMPAFVAGQFLTSAPYGATLGKATSGRSQGSGMGPASVAADKLGKMKMPPGQLGAMYDRTKLFPRPSGGRNHPMVTSGASPK